MKRVTMLELLRLKRKLDRILDYVDDTWFGFLAGENITPILKRNALEWF